MRTYYYNAPLDMSRDKEKYRKQQQFFETLRKMPNFLKVEQKNYGVEIKTKEMNI